MTIASMQKICGFVVVRKPEFASTNLIRSNMHVAERTYRGVDRLRWEDFDAAYYERRLPEDLMPIWQELDRDTLDFSGMKLLKEYEAAREVLAFSGTQNELVAIWSRELEEIKGAPIVGLDLNYLGIDCYALGEWSLLLAGAYFLPEHFSETVCQLNPWGLLSSDDASEVLTRQYLKLSETERVEPLMNEPNITNIRVYQVSCGNH